MHTRKKSRIQAKRHDGICEKFMNPESQIKRMMARCDLVRRLYTYSPLYGAVLGGSKSPILCFHSNGAAAVAPSFEETNESNVKRCGGGEWFILMPFTPVIDGPSLGKELARRQLAKEHETSSTYSTTYSSMTALKWILRCCPELPRSLVQKLFRLRQVRRASDCTSSSEINIQTLECRLKRVVAKEQLKVGDRIFLPRTVQNSLPKVDCCCSEEEIEFLRSLELYKDEAIVAINKPPGMPVQGGRGIQRSLDELAAVHMRYNSTEPPRLVHRLDRDSSGVLVMGRTQLSSTLLHSVFREKTRGASCIDIDSKKNMLQRRYWALVLGCPRRLEGTISKPLAKVVLDDGKSERIIVANDGQTLSSQYAITNYGVVDSYDGYTWLELSPLTGRKHQLRVHCAEVLGTPIVGDYKYGWQVHRKWKHVAVSNCKRSLTEKLRSGKPLPFGFDLENGSILDKHPRLHLHCREMVLPNVSMALQYARLSDCNLTEVESLKLVAPLPLHMQRSFELLKS